MKILLIALKKDKVLPQSKVKTEDDVEVMKIDTKDDVKVSKMKTEEDVED